MNRSDHDLDKLERLLAGAHRARPEPRLDAAWSLRVMRDIRREAAGVPQERSMWIERHVWRTAAAAAMFAVIFAGSVLLYTDVGTGGLTAVVAEGLDLAPALIE
jgi:hypothetical protein